MPAPDPTPAPRRPRNPRKPPAGAAAAAPPADPAAGPGVQAPPPPGLAAAPAADLGPDAGGAVSQARPEPPPLTAEQAGRYEALRAWRRRLAGLRGVPPYIILANATLAEAARHHPRTLAELATVRGIGPYKLAAYGPGLLAALAAPAAAFTAEDPLVRVAAVLAAAELRYARREADGALLVTLPGEGARVLAVVPVDAAPAPAAG